MNTHRRVPARGFTLIEAMIGLLIMSFGILALAGMQIMLSRNADVSKQRAEAMRLAQERIETMRSFTHIAPVETATVNDAATPDDPDLAGTTKRLAWDDLATASDANNPLTSTFSNTTFNRSWSVGGAITDAMRPVSVTVSWTDRAGQGQSVTLNSVISQSDPTKVGSLGFPLPNNTNLKLPKDRSLNIPVPAIDVGGGKSAYQLGGNLAVIFSNVSGYVVEKCTQTVTAANYQAGTAGCTEYDAYILAGYVTGDSGALVNSAASPPVPTQPTGINTAQVTFDNTNDKVISCTYGVAKNQTSGAYILSSHYYLCVIPVATSNGNWAGTVRLGGVPTGGNYKVCRFEYAASNFANENERNRQPYVNVRQSLDNQNYYIDTSNGNSCPSIDGLQTVLHQNCRSNNANAATDCPATANNTPE